MLFHRIFKKHGLRGFLWLLTMDNKDWTRILLHDELLLQSVAQKILVASRKSTKLPTTLYKMHPDVPLYIFRQAEARALPTIDESLPPLMHTSDATLLTGDLNNESSPKAGPKRAPTNAWVDLESGHPSGPIVPTTSVEPM
jgi:hypothetical protein